MIENYLSKNLSVIEQRPFSCLPSRDTNKISTAVQHLYLGPGYTTVPGVTNLLFIPYDFYKSLKAVFEAQKIGDREGVIENGLRSLEAPFTLSHAGLQVSWYLIQIGIFFKVLSESLSFVLKPLSTFTAGAGMIFSAIEGILETLGLIRSVYFLKKISFSTIEENQKEKIYFNFLSKLENTYFDLSPEEIKKIDDYIIRNFSSLSRKDLQRRKEQIIEANLRMKKSQLVRRLHHRLTNVVEQQIPEILAGLIDPVDEKRQKAIKQAELLFGDMRTQSYKNLLIHSIGLLAVAITLAGLISGLVVCPYLLPFILIAVGGVLSLTRYYLYLGFSETQGWHFDFDRCNVVKRIYRQIFPERKENSPPHLSPILHFKLRDDHERKNGMKLHQLDFTLSLHYLKA